MSGQRRRWVKKDPNNQRGRIAIRYRAYPSEEQVAKGRRIGGSCRQVKNLAKEQRDLTYRYSGKSPTYTLQTKSLKELRDDPVLAPWSAEVPAQVLQQALRDTDNGYQRFFAGETGYPRWAKRSGWVSFRDPQGVEVRRLSRRWGEVKIQGLGWVKVRMHRLLVGKRICSAAYTEEPDGKVFVSVLMERRRRGPTKARIETRAS